MLLDRAAPLPPLPDLLPDSTRRTYCDWLRSVQQFVLPGTAEAQQPAQAQSPKLQAPVQGKVTLSNWSAVATAADRVREADRRADRYAVEVHKKWAISLACITFVIIGIVMAPSTATLATALPETVPKSEEETTATFAAVAPAHHLSIRIYGKADAVPATGKLGHGCG